jgi:hypothetical protein
LIPLSTDVPLKELRKLSAACVAERSGLPDAPRAVLRAAASALARARGLDGEMFRRSRLMSGDEPALDTPAISALAEHFGRAPVVSLGHLHEVLLDTVGRKRTGSYFTPVEIAARVTEAALNESVTSPSICDPASGGGVFLLEAARQLAQRAQLDPRAALDHIHGVDLDPLAVAVTEAALWLWCADPHFDPAPLRQRLISGDALVRGWERDLLAVGQRGFDLVIGNPPWVAYAGRAAQRIDPEVRRQLARDFRSFRGYPTLQGLFVERATELAPSGVIALLVPSPLADLEGYRPVRRVLGATHAPCEPLLELGQDAFDGVTQPCFALIARPGSGATDGRPWRLMERQRKAGAATEVEVPEVLKRVASLPSLPRELFGELGFQSAGNVAKTLFLRADEPDERHTLPLLEGKRVGEFRVGSPALFLDPDRDALARAGCRLRPPEHFHRARFVVRQTAKYPIAALYPGLPFRNTLLAGFDHDEISPELAVALLNSSLYRALHLALRRDARQAAFPQVKVSHLRALPRPPQQPRAFAALAELTRRITVAGVEPSARLELDERVFDLFDLSRSEREAVLGFVAARG